MFAQAQLAAPAPTSQEYTLANSIILLLLIIAVLIIDRGAHWVQRTLEADDHHARRDDHARSSRR